MLMNILRRFGLSIVISLFSLVTLSFALGIGAYFVLDRPAPIEQALRSSGIYEVFVGQAIISNSGQDSAELQEPGVQQALQKAFPPSYLQTNTEAVINATYDWVHGVTQSPQFSIDLTGPKATFADAISQYTTQRLGALPRCTVATAPPTDIQSALALTCLPKGVSVASVGALVKQDAATVGPFKQASNSLSDKLPGQTRVTSSAIKPGSISGKLAVIPKAHHYFVLGLYIAPLLLLLCGVAIIFWSATKRAGAKHIARTLITIGVLTILSSILSTIASEKLGKLLVEQQGSLATLQTHIVNIMTAISKDLQFWWIICGGAYILIGVIIFVILGVTKQRQPKQPKPHRLDYARYTSGEDTEQESSDADEPSSTGDDNIGPAVPGQPGDTPELPRNRSRKL